MKKVALALLLAFSSFAYVASAQEVIRIAPPRDVVEHRGHAPEHGMVWIGGHHRWDHDHYVWVPGRWDHPPHEGAVWVPHRWEHHGDHYIFVEGHWR